MPKKVIKVKKSKDEPDEPAGAPKLFDVAKPGQTAANPTSRPIIVGHGPMIKQDPMVIEKKEEKPESKTSQKVSINEGVAVEPPEEKKPENEDPKPEPKPKAEAETPEKTDKKDTTPEPEATPSMSEEEPAEESAPAEQETSTNDTKPESEEEADSPAASTDEKSETNDSEASEGEATGTTDLPASKAALKKDDKKKQEEEDKKAEEVSKMIVSRKYFVQIHQGPAGHSYSSWLLVLLLVMSVGIVVAIDAGVLNIGIALPFDLIKN